MQRHRFPNFTLPHDQVFPGQRFQLGLISLISRDVLVEFTLPEVDVRAGPFRALAALVAVPKAAMNKNDFLMPAQYDIGIPRQVLTIQTKTKAHPVNEGSYG